MRVKKYSVSFTLASSVAIAERSEKSGEEREKEERREKMFTFGGTTMHRGGRVSFSLTTQVGGGKKKSK